MSTHNRQVVVGYDFSNSGREALTRAIAIATGASAHVLHFVCAIDGSIPAVPHSGKVDFAYSEMVQRALADLVAEELRAANASDTVHFFVHARIGKPAEEILEVARQIGADLIVLGTKSQTGLERMMLGSVAETVVREAGCSVEVARARTYSDVELLEITDSTEPHHAYVAPHRYSWENTRVPMRPTDFPLY